VILKKQGLEIQGQGQRSQDQGRGLGRLPVCHNFTRPRMPRTRAGKNL